MPELVKAEPKTTQIWIKQVKCIAKAQSAERLEKTSCDFHQKKFYVSSPSERSLEQPIQ